MKTNHYFNGGSRRCVNCGLAEDDVEFSRSCPMKAQARAISDIPLEFDHIRPERLHIQQARPVVELMNAA